MADQSSDFTPLGITIPAATTDELLHALSVTVITQQATINLLSGLLLQVYCTVNQMPLAEGEALHDRLFASCVASANQGFVDTLRERQHMIKSFLHQ
ncbi:hypothetical protein [Hymenobacter sp. YC55]|uniref:hypothetical protein n=1 Tax=Hymenobacter sp. YC55 TaxID=3034019 RepID=UPI0023F6E391|nr:hypothetical protein [Hymenobacter sp. YC55]MDF7810937.1 hypothetical protein [Hymenobacter sp. YC55]